MLLFHTIGLEESLAEKTLTAFYRSRITDFSRYNFLRKETRLFISKNYHKGLYPPVSSEKSGDGTEKFLFRNPDGLEFESVFIPEERRQTLCVSVQSGCRMGCPFCITGRLPYRGNLSAGDIINQLLSVPVSAQITHVVFMGMGEPLDNFAQVLKACEILSAQWGLAIAASKVTVSTVGILPEMETFLKESVCNLTLSLFSPFQEERAGMLPAARIYSLNKLIDCMKNSGPKKGRRLSVAYLMIKGLNDSDEHVNGIADLLKGSGIRVNLLSCHYTGNERFRSSSAERIHYFRKSLMERGISASIRKSRGIEISAACGQLAAGAILPPLPVEKDVR